MINTPYSGDWCKHTSFSEFSRGYLPETYGQKAPLIHSRGGGQGPGEPLELVRRAPCLYKKTISPESVAYLLGHPD